MITQGYSTLSCKKVMTTNLLKPKEEEGVIESSVTTPQGTQTTWYSETTPHLVKQRLEKKEEPPR